jgi:splicing factor 3B subunit 1
MQANKDSTSAKSKRRWEVTAPKDENVDPNQPSAGERSFTLPRPTNAVPAGMQPLPMSSLDKHPWDQTPASASLDTTMVPIIMDAPGFMHEDKHNRYLTDEELDAVLPATGYPIVAPPPGYAPMVAPRRLIGTPIAEPRGFHIQEGSDTAAIAAAGLSPELPTEIPGVRNLAFFKAEDAEYFAKILREEGETQLSVEEMNEQKIIRL